MKPLYLVLPMLMLSSFTQARVMTLSSEQPAQSPAVLGARAEAPPSGGSREWLKNCLKGSSQTHCLELLAHDTPTGTSTGSGAAGQLSARFETLKERLATLEQVCAQHGQAAQCDKLKNLMGQRLEALKTRLSQVMQGRQGTAAATGATATTGTTTSTTTTTSSDGTAGAPAPALGVQ